MIKSFVMNETLQKLIKREEERQQNTINLIPSENFTSKAVREATGSIFMHKYSEGNIGVRYYEGNEVVDELESECIRMVKKVMIHDDGLRNEWESNVQVLSGSTANLAVYNAVLNPGDTILSMYLPDGGHLSHGWSHTPSGEKSNIQNPISKVSNDDIYLGGSVKSNFNSKIFNIIQYRVDKETELINYDKLLDHLKKFNPKLFIVGGTAYPRYIDYKKIREVLDEYKSETGNRVLFLADVAHEAGLIAGGVHPSPFESADFVTFTTHKTLRGPRGAVVMCRREFIDAVNKSVMPGLLGGPFNHTIAGLLQTLYESDSDEFKNYSEQVVKNAKLLAELFMKKGYRVVSGGTDKHMVLVDFSNKGISGRAVSKALAMIGIITNKNTVPFEKGTPVSPSGVRFGTPFVTTRGFKETEINQTFEVIEKLIEVASSVASETFKEFVEKISSKKSDLDLLAKEVAELCSKFPLNI